MSCGRVHRSEGGIATVFKLSYVASKVRPRGVAHRPTHQSNFVSDMNGTSLRAPLTPGDIDGVVAKIRALTHQVASVDAQFSRIRRMLSKSSLDPDDKLSQYHKARFLACVEVLH